MKKMKSWLLGIAVIAASSIHAQTIDEVIGKHIEAMGGKEKLSKVKSIYSESTFEAMGRNAPAKDHLVEGKGYRTEADFDGTRMVTCFSDKSGWIINPITNGPRAEAMPDELNKSGRSQIYVSGGLLDYKSKGYKAELAGKEGDAFKIKLSDASSETFHFIDSKTYLLTKTIIKGEVMGQAAEVTTTYSDYKKTDFGIMLPYTKNIDMGLLQFSQKIEKFEVNKQIDPKIFEMPK